ncbi:MAG: 50S ribosomal protein L6 [Salinivirgaceae bacterium]
MSRIGKLPVAIPKGVTVTVDAANMVVVKGPKGQLQQQVNPEIKVNVEGEELVLARPSDSIAHKSMHGLYRSLLKNMIVGVSDGYTIIMEFVGVGYRAEAKGQMLEMSLGYSHSIIFELPGEIKVEALTDRRANPKVTLTSCDKQLIGQIAAKIRAFRKPEPYKGKGIKFEGEVLRRKAGKSAGK